MADSLSVIGSAAGVASLGILVCQSLTAYSQAIGERKHQIKDDLRNLQNLQSLFMVITDVLPQLRQNHSSEYAAVKKCLFDCEDHLVRMQGLLSTIDKSYPGDSLKGKLKQVVQLTTYPYRERELSHIRQHIQDHLKPLQLAVGITTLKSHMESSTIAAEVKAGVKNLESASNATQNLITNLSVQTQQNSDEIIALKKAVSQGFDAVSSVATRTEWGIRDAKDEICSRLSIFHDDTTALSSENLIVYNGQNDISSESGYSPIMILARRAHERDEYLKSADVLFSAGCIAQLGVEYASWLYHISQGFLNLFLGHLVQRRRSLVKLGQRELGIYQDWDMSVVMVKEAPLLYEALTSAGIPVSSHLSVPARYFTVFHSLDIGIQNFPVLWQNGFRNYDCYNDIGLTSVIVWRNKEFSMNRQVENVKVEERKRVLGWTWLQSHGCPDMRQRNPRNLGLNRYSIGWHYMSSMIGLTATSDMCWGNPPPQRGGHYNPPLAWEMVSRLLRIDSRDRCKCWCTPNMGGCSGLTSLWKEYGSTLSVLIYLRRCSTNKWPPDLFWRHILTHHTPNSMEHIALHQKASLCFVQFLTFEALVMTHSCCILEDLGTLESYGPPNPMKSAFHDIAKRTKIPKLKHYNWALPSSLLGIDVRMKPWQEIKYQIDITESPRVIANCDNKISQEIMADPSEQENARILQQLMAEFEEPLSQLDTSDPRFLKRFIWGPWRQRISELYAVNPRVIAQMKEAASNVTTYEIPVRLQTLLGEKFSLLRLDTEGTSSQMKNVEEELNKWERDCPYCNVMVPEEPEENEGREKDNKGKQKATKWSGAGTR